MGLERLHRGIAQEDVATLARALAKRPRFSIDEAADHVVAGLRYYAQDKEGGRTELCSLCERLATIEGTERFVAALMAAFERARAQGLVP